MRRLATSLLAVLALAALAAGCGDGSSEESSGERTDPAAPETSASTSAPASTAPPTTLPPHLTLPDGTRSLFPEHRVVAFYGAASTPELGVLGATSPDEAVHRLEVQAAPYRAGGKPVLLALELIGTIAADSPGSDGNYNNRSRPEAVQEYLDAARRAGAILIIDVQPGQGSLLDEVRYYEEFLRQPDVGLAIDPEWAMDPGEVPGEVIGHTDAATINAISQYLVDLVVAHRLPEKLLVVHQFTHDMIEQPEQVLPRSEVAVTFHIDGFGPPEEKLPKYAALHRPPPFTNGFKVFYEQDDNVMSPEQVLALQPPPDLITYQ